MNTPGRRTGPVAPHPERDRGAVTVEAAIALVALLLVVAIGVAGIVAVTDQLRATDAAREAARLLARGDSDNAAQAVDRIAPPRAQWEFAEEPDGITVVVRADPAGGLLPGVTVRGEAFAVPEPGVAAEELE